MAGVQVEWRYFPSGQFLGPDCQGAPGARRVFRQVGGLRVRNVTGLAPVARFGRPAILISAGLLAVRARLLGGVRAIIACIGIVLS